MLKTFSIGGVHPHENKLSAHQPIIKAEIPAKAAILLGQHIGAPAKPIVAKGDVVKVGTKIAEPGGFVSALSSRQRFRPRPLSCWDSTSVLLPSLSLPKVML